MPQLALSSETIHRARWPLMGVTSLNAVCVLCAFYDVYHKEGAFHQDFEDNLLSQYIDLDLITPVFFPEAFDDAEFERVREGFNSYDLLCRTAPPHLGIEAFPSSLSITRDILVILEEYEGHPTTDILISILSLLEHKDLGILTHGPLNSDFAALDDVAQGLVVTLRLLSDPLIGLQAGALLTYGTNFGFKTLMDRYAAQAPILPTFSIWEYASAVLDPLSPDRIELAEQELAKIIETPGEVEGISVSDLRLARVPLSILSTESTNASYVQPLLSFVSSVWDDISEGNELSPHSIDPLASSPSYGT